MMREYLTRAAAWISQGVFASAGGWNWAFTFSGWFPRPFVSHRGARWQWYIGWRPPHGALGVKFQRVQK